MSLLLAIETSCDETAAAVVEDGRRIRSNVVASQIDLHRPYGGIFPEIAARQHVLDIAPVIQRALTDAAVTWEDLAALAVTRGPGLAGSLLVGVNTAKAIALARDLPIVAINHMEGHLYSNWLDEGGKIDPGAILRPSLPALDATGQAFPLLVLIVSGGHSELILMHDHGSYERVGRTLDDAAGEAFDKVARLLGLSYPGGPAIQRAAEGGNPKAFDFPRALTNHPEHRFDFSFSGLKTAVLRQVRELDPEHLPVADLAASFQEAVVDVLMIKTADAAREYGVGRVCVCGGVAANRALRAAAAARLPVPASIPPFFLCTDNAAMIGAAAHYRFLQDGPTGLDFDVEPNLGLSVDWRAHARGTNGNL
ncbi:MAG: tRNA (adenosine(37)-N6)-threonylcarbamoyltransferase complex transferase subunit TsaD [Chloroflexi bacterium HGW-Chloroflexi-1]|nr:MAG: tRNA (adenosine(37)-N6)-threonylcarbamoyltransferase complex transferase subunit TsaD [Chloroflexi bacterium HGW-Chloroflexi-1]